MALAGCASSSDGGSGGGSGDTLIIGSDLPLQGAQKDTSDSTNKAMQLYLDQLGGKVGKYNVKLKIYDDSTAAKGAWDSGQCTSNATAHVQNKDEVAVMGTFNSGCAKIEVPILNQAPGGGMLMVSHANTNVGLTKTFEEGEPDKYYPTGKRNYARVVTTDDIQGAADVKFLAKEGSKKCYILNDNQTYGQGVAKVFADNAQKNGVQILANEPWDAKATDYKALFGKVKAAGADCVFLGGIVDNNGLQLVKDKVAVLGDNAKVKLMAPDGFTGSADLNSLKEAQGMYLSQAGLSLEPLRANGGKAAEFLDAYKAKYGSDPKAAYVLYGVAALQVILAAIEKSDGTRASITSQVVGGSTGITISKDESVIGKEFTIDPAVGDVDAKDISVEIIKGNAEVFQEPSTP